MKIFKFQYSIFILVAVMSIRCTPRDKGSTSEAVDQYTCPMHPTVVQAMPGTCPICAMDLVLKGRTGAEVKITAELNYLLKPTNAVITASISTITPEQKSMLVETKANGMITYDTRRFTSVPIRFGGRLEKLLVKYNFQPIRKGQKVLEIYSPELLTAQRDLLYLVRADGENVQMIEGAKEKLSLLGIEDSQISKLISTGQEIYSFAVYSPVDGYIVETQATPLATASSPQQSGGTPAMSGGMSGGSSSGGTQGLSTVNELLVREGMYVRAGQSIFNVVNTEQIWAEFDVYTLDRGLIKINDPAKIVVDNSADAIEAKVNFVQPFYKGGENFTKVRVYLTNPASQFRVGQLATVSFSIPSGASMWIPLSAKLDLGLNQIVFAKRRGVFRPKIIVTGHQSGEWIEVLSGLEAADSLAYNAQFMVDSEGFIKVKN